MKTFVRVFVVSLTVCGVASPLTTALAKSTAPLPPAARYYPLIGKWNGEGNISMPGQPKATLTLKLSCDKVSSGWAVHCSMIAKNKEMTMTETDLMGVDPVTGTGHWYAITNQGETHDHITKWSDAHTMKAHYAWAQDGKKMDENITIALTGKKTMRFNSTVSEDGKEASVFIGKLMR